MSELYAQMLLNTIQIKGTGAFSQNVFKSISRAAGLALCGSFGNQAFPFNLSTYIAAITGTGENKFTVKWIVHVQNTLNTGNIVYTVGDDSYSVLQRGETSHDGALKNLHIQDGEEKILVETVAWYKRDTPSSSAAEVFNRAEKAQGFDKMFYFIKIPVTEITTSIGKIHTFGDRTAIITPESIPAAAPS
jgi:hypothetical protein